MTATSNESRRAANLGTLVTAADDEARRAAWLAEQNAKQPAREATFKLVQPKTHWKDPIDAVVAIDADLAAIDDAVVHFTGAGCTFKRVAGGWHVQAPGYYATIGA